MKILCFTLIVLSMFLLSYKIPEIPVKGYSLAWSDEFNGKELNTNKWVYRGLGKRGEEYITKETVKLDGKGHLVMSVAQRNDSILTSMIATENIMQFKYGYFECRAKYAKAKGTISAFWLQSPQINAPNSTPETSGAEIDIFELYPHLGTDHVLQSLHWGGYGARHRMEGPVYGKLANTGDDFHIIGFEWTDTSYATYVDGVKTFSGNQLISKVPEFIVLSLGVSQAAAGPLDVKSLPDEFIVDYVRVYKKN